MKVFLLSAIIAVQVTAALAAGSTAKPVDQTPPITVVINGDANGKGLKSLGLNPGQYSIETEGTRQIYRPKQSAAEEVKKYKVKLKAEAEEGYTADAMAYALRGSENAIYGGMYWDMFGTPIDTVSIEVPDGVYDVYMQFLPHAGTGPKPVKMVIKEGVEVKGADVNVTLRSADANIRLSYETVNRNGEKFVLDEATLGAYGAQTVTKEGNAKRIFTETYFVPKEHFGHIFARGYYNKWDAEADFLPDADAAQASDVMISPVSDRWFVTQLRTIVDKNNNIYAVKYRQDGASESKTVTNDPAKLKSYTETFVQSAYGKQSGTKPTAGISLQPIWSDNLIKTNTYVSTPPLADLDDEGKIQFYIDAPDDAEQSDGQMLLRPVPLSVDSKNSNQIFATIGTPVDINNSNRRDVVGLNDLASLSKTYPTVQTTGMSMPVMAYKANPAFSYMPEQKTGEYGESAPIAVFRSLAITGSWKTGFSDTGTFYGDPYTVTKFPTFIAYMGRLGETRHGDIPSAKMSLKYGGEEIASGAYLNICNLVDQWEKTKHSANVCNLQLTNENIEVDGLKGKNVSTVEYDLRKDDVSAPTLTFLQFRNAKTNDVTDRFDNAADGRIALSAGDFNFDFTNSVATYNEERPASVTVEYAPFGKENWQPVEIAENEEYFQKEGLGNYYEGTLKSITGTSETGWYDLRITITDKAGNSQKQVVSPAFKIGEGNSGVAALQSATDLYAYVYANEQIRIVGAEAAAIDLYNAAGALVARSSDGVSNPISTASLPAGIYVARLTADNGTATTSKLVVK